MNIPSIKTIEDRLVVPRAMAREIRSLLERDRNGENARKTLTLIEPLLVGHQTFGVESIYSTGMPSIAYINMGDTYDTTVMNVGGRWVIGAWGDIVEKGGYE